MNRSFVAKFLRLSLAFLLGSVGFTAMTAPQVDDLVEIRSWLNARSEASFRPSDNNKVSIIKPGTRAEVVETKYFPHTKNYGVCLKTLNSSSGDRCVWVYYNTKNPNMNLYAVHGDADTRKALLSRWMSSPKSKTADFAKKTEAVSSPEDAQAAQTTREASGISEREPSSTLQTTAGAATAGVDGKGVDTNALMKGTLNAISSINADIQRVLNPNPTCKECSTKILTYETCNSKNDYMESSLENLKNNPIMSQILSAPNDQNPGAIRAECFKKGMETFNASGAFRQCNSGNDARNAPHLKKACVSEDYVNVTTQSFNAVANCLSGYVSGSSDPEVNRVTALSIFTMINTESGFHVNALSPTGAGGPGQFTQSAIDGVNKNMGALKEYLAKSNNPLCKSTIAKALEPPMDGRPSKSCERINLSDNNPLRNLIYTFAYQASNHRYINGIFENPAYQDVISGFSPKWREAFLSGLMTWSHNTGSAGMETPLRKLLRTAVQQNWHLSSNKNDLAKFMTALSTEMRQYPNPGNSSTARRRETSIYYPSITARMAIIGNQMPGGVRGCFVHP